MGSILRRTASGMRWTATEMVVQQGVQFAITAVLAHLLAPSAFGLLAMAMTAIGLLTVLRDLGVGDAVVQSKDVDDRFLSTVHWLCVLSGAVLTGAGIASAVPVALLYDEPALVPVIRCLGALFLINSLGMVPTSVLRREMRFQAISSVSILSILARGVVGISFAVAGYGVWSLVMMELAGATVMVIGVRTALKWRPKMAMSRSGAKRALRFGLGLTGFGIFNYLARNADRVLIGSFLGKQALGYYSLAYRLMHLPVSRLGALIGRTMFPALSRLQEEPARLRKAYLREVGAISTLSFPMMFGLFAVAHVFVPVVLGEQWTPAVPIVQVLCMLGAVEAVGTTIGQIYMVRARTGLIFVWGAISGTLRVGAFAAGLHWGPLGVAVAYLISDLVLLPIGVSIALGLIDLKLRDMGKALLMSFENAFIMLAAVGVATYGMLQAGLPGVVNLVVSISLGALLYGWLVWARRPAAVADMLAVLPVHRLPVIGEAIGNRFNVVE